MATIKPGKPQGICQRLEIRYGQVSPGCKLQSLYESNFMQDTTARARLCAEQNKQRLRSPNSVMFYITILYFIYLGMMLSHFSAYF